MVVSAALSSVVKIREARLLSTTAAATIYRGRSRRADDVFPYPIIWEGIYGGLGSTGDVTAMMVSGVDSYDYQKSGTLIVAARQMVKAYTMPMIANDVALVHFGGNAYLSVDDAGMPELNKQWLDITVKGYNVGANNKFDLWYRIDPSPSSTSWTRLVKNGATSPSTTSFTNITGRAIQLKLNILDHATDWPTEINEIEVRFRELPTYKWVYTFMLEIADGQTTPNGAPMPEANIQLANLAGDMDTYSRTLITPLGESKTVNIVSMRQVEYLQEGLETPIMLVEIVAAEV
jgi:hypothetical protein